MVEGNFKVAQNIYVTFGKSDELNNASDFVSVYPYVRVMGTGQNAYFRFYKQNPATIGLKYYRDFNPFTYVWGREIEQNITHYNQITDAYETTATEIANDNQIRIRTEIYYSDRFTSLLLQFLILSYLMFYLPIKLVMRLFRKGRL